MRTLVVAVVTVVLANSVVASAENFPWFNVRQHEGWVEYSQPGRARVKLLPFVAGPDATARSTTMFDFEQVPSHVPAPEITSDGRLELSYLIVIGSSVLSSSFAELATQTGVSVHAIAGGVQTFVKPTFRSVSLQIGGRTFETKRLDTSKIASGAAGSFQVPLDSYDTIAKLRSGDYRFVLAYTYPAAEYRSLSLDHQPSTIANAWITAFRDVLHTDSDFSTRVACAHLHHQLTSVSGNKVVSTTTVELDDPTPERRQRTEAVLGFARTTYDDVLTRHHIALTEAQASGAPSLAEAHAAFLIDLTTRPRELSHRLTEALSNLGDAELLSFLAAGFRSGSTAIYYRYDSALVASVDANQKAQYDDYLIRSSKITNRSFSYSESAEGSGAAIERAYESLHRAAFGQDRTHPLSAAQWARGMARAIAERNLTHLTYGLDPGVVVAGGSADPNIPIDGDGNRLLHAAVATNDPRIVELLLQNGASPGRRNRDGKAARDVVAGGAGAGALRALLSEYGRKKGRAVVRLRHPGMTVLGVEMLAPTDVDSASHVASEGDRTEVTIEDFPTRMPASMLITARAFVTRGDYPDIHVPHQIINEFPTCVEIEIHVLVARTYRIFDGTTSVYDETLAIDDYSHPHNACWP